MASAGAGSPAASAASATMMFVKAENSAVVEELSKILDPEHIPAEGEAKDLQISDFDGCKWRVELQEKKVHVSIVVPGFKELAKYGLDAQLRGLYGSLLSSPKDGADVTLAFSTATDAPAEAEARAAFIKKIAGLRKNVLAAPFMQSFAAATAAGGAAESLLAFSVRPSEPVFIAQRGDRVTVIYAIDFADPTDRAVARAICQSFLDSQRHVGGAPSLSFSDRDPPLELRGKAEHAGFKPGESFVGYLSFGLFARQLDSEAKKAGVASLLTGFRGYLDYHIKAAKSYLHSRMRTRVDTWLQVLNRAQLEDPFASKEKKLASGKTFVKK